MKKSSWLKLKFHRGPKIKSDPLKFAPRPERDWRALIIGWLIFMLLILATGFFIWPLGLSSQTPSSAAPTLSRANLERALKMTAEREAEFEKLLATPPFTVDPSI